MRFAPPYLDFDVLRCDCSRRIIHRLSSQKHIGAFSLMELLVVMALISILAALGVRGVAGMSGDDYKKALISISNSLEIARQTAVAQNTYTYVAFTSPADPNNTASPFCVAVFQSNSGADVLKGAISGGQPLLPEGTSGTGPGSWKLLTRPEWLRNSIMESTRNAPVSVLPSQARIGDGFAATIDTANGGVGFEIRRMLGDMPQAASLKFDRIVTFSPSGTAYVDNAAAVPTASIGVLLKPITYGAESRVAAVLVNGLMGSSRIYQQQIP